MRNPFIQISTHFVTYDPDQQLYVKTIENSSTLTLEFLANRLMEEMVTVVNTDQARSLRSPSPCQGTMDKLRTRDIKDPGVDYEPSSSRAPDEATQCYLVRAMILRQLLQDADAYDHNYEIPSPSGSPSSNSQQAQSTTVSPHILSLDFGYAFYTLTSKHQGSESLDNEHLDATPSRVLYEHFLNPESKEALLVSLIFNRPDTSTEFRDNHSILQQSGIINSQSLEGKKRIFTELLFTLNQLKALKHESFIGCQKDAVENFSNPKSQNSITSEDMQKLTELVNNAMVLFSNRLTLAHSLIKDQQLDFDVDKFKEIYIAWSKDYLGETENEEEIADIVKEAEDWVIAFQQVQAARNDVRFLEQVSMVSDDGQAHNQTPPSSRLFFRSLSTENLSNPAGNESPTNLKQCAQSIRP